MALLPRLGTQAARTDGPGLDARLQCAVPAAVSLVVPCLCPKSAVWSSTQLTGTTVVAAQVTWRVPGLRGSTCGHALPPGQALSASGPASSVVAPACAAEPGALLACWASGDVAVARTLRRDSRGGSARVQEPEAHSSSSVTVLRHSFVCIKSLRVTRQEPRNDLSRWANAVREMLSEHGRREHASHQAGPPRVLTPAPPATQGRLAPGGGTWLAGRGRGRGAGGPGQGHALWWQVPMGPREGKQGVGRGGLVSTRVLTAAAQWRKTLPDVSGV